MTATHTTLKDFNLKLTGCRADVLEAFQKTERALSNAELEQIFKNRVDRVTIYRTLKTFLDKGLIHKVLDDGGTKYALCKAACGHAHNHDHVHFKCIKCGETNCLETVHIPAFNLPKNYQLTALNLLAEGICPKC